MRLIVQRARDAKCVVDGKLISSIDFGYMVLVGIKVTDTIEEMKKCAKKLAGLRVFEDENGKLNKAIKDVDGSIMAISQFTLYGNVKKGNRPSFLDAMSYEEANPLYLEFVSILENEYNIKVAKGVFGADMDISFTNVGPCTIIIDSQDL